MATDKLVDFDHVTDYISREAAIEALEIHARATRHNLSIYPDIVSEHQEVIWDVPAADVRPVVRGGWKPNSRNPYWLNCTVCGYAKPERNIYHFCPNCGADMRDKEGKRCMTN